MNIFCYARRPAAVDATFLSCTFASIIFKSFVMVESWPTYVFNPLSRLILLRALMKKIEEMSSNFEMIYPMAVLQTRVVVLYFSSILTQTIKRLKIRQRKRITNEIHRLRIKFMTKFLWSCEVPNCTAPKPANSPIFFTKSYERVNDQI